MEPCISLCNLVQEPFLVGIATPKQCWVQPMFLSFRGVTMFVLKYHVSSNFDSQQLRAFYRAIRAAMKSLVKSAMNANISLMN
jgi:hypothetical protein